MLHVPSCPFSNGFVQSAMDDEVDGIKDRTKDSCGDQSSREELRDGQPKKHD